MLKKLKDTTVVVESDFLAFVANFELGDISLMEWCFAPGSIAVAI